MRRPDDIDFIFVCSSTILFAALRNTFSASNYGLHHNERFAVMRSEGNINIKRSDMIVGRKKQRFYVRIRGSVELRFQALIQKILNPGTQQYKLSD